MTLVQSCFFKTLKLRCKTLQTDEFFGRYVVTMGTLLLAVLQLLASRKAARGVVAFCPHSVQGGLDNRASRRKSPWSSLLKS